MTAAAALARAQAAGLTLTAEGDRLRWRGPRPPSDLLADLRAHKAELLVLLGANGVTVLPPPASPEQAEAERQDRAAVAAEGAAPASAAQSAAPVTAVVGADLLAAWERELAGLLAAAPGQRITDPERAADYFRAEARRRLAQLPDDRMAAGLLMGSWRHRRCQAT